YPLWRERGDQGNRAWHDGACEKFEALHRCHLLEVEQHVRNLKMPSLRLLDRPSHERPCTAVVLAGVQRSWSAATQSSKTTAACSFASAINIGDVIHAEARPFGNAVDHRLPARGSRRAQRHCTSGAAYEQVRNKLALKVTDLLQCRVRRLNNRPARS